MCSPSWEATNERLERLKRTHNSSSFTEQSIVGTRGGEVRIYRLLLPKAKTEPVGHIMSTLTVAT